MEGVRVREFGMGEEKVIVKMGGRGWRDRGTGKRLSVGIEVDMVGKGRGYCKEFGGFLKERYGDVGCEVG